MHTPIPEISGFGAMPVQTVLEDMIVDGQV